MFVLQSPSPEGGSSSTATCGTILFIPMGAGYGTVEQRRCTACMGLSIRRNGAQKLVQFQVVLTFLPGVTRTYYTWSGTRGNIVPWSSSACCPMGPCVLPWERHASVFTGRLPEDLIIISQGEDTVKVKMQLKT